MALNNRATSPLLSARRVLPAPKQTPRPTGLLPSGPGCDRPLGPGASRVGGPTGAPTISAGDCALAPRAAWIPSAVTGGCRSGWEARQATLARLRRWAPGATAQALDQNGLSQNGYGHTRTPRRVGGGGSMLGWRGCRWRWRKRGGGDHDGSMLLNAALPPNLLITRRVVV